MESRFCLKPGFQGTSTIPVLNANLYTEVGTVSDDKSGLVIQFRRGGDWKTDKSTRASGGPVRVEATPADEDRPTKLTDDECERLLAAAVGEMRTLLITC